MNPSAGWEKSPRGQSCSSMVILTNTCLISMSSTRLPSLPKSFGGYPDAGHTTASQLYPEEHTRRVVEFFNRVSLISDQWQSPALISLNLNFPDNGSGFYRPELVSLVGESDVTSHQRTTFPSQVKGLLDEVYQLEKSTNG